MNIYYLLCIILNMSNGGIPLQVFPEIMSEILARNRSFRKL